MSQPPPIPPMPPSGGYTASTPGGPSAGPALSYGWTKFQQTAGVFVGIIVISFIAQIVISLVGQTAASGSIILSLMVSVLGFIISLVAQYGMFNAALMVTRGQTPTFNNAFQNDRWGEWIGFSIIYGICVGVGIILCGVGILLTAGLFGLAPFFFIDGRQSIGQAIGSSFNLTKSNGSLLLAVIICELVGFAGFIACGVGALVTIPLATMAVATLYRGATNQPVAA